jgi:hypothetical protein
MSPNYVLNIGEILTTAIANAVASRMQEMSARISEVQETSIQSEDQRTKPRGLTASTLKDRGSAGHALPS